MKTSFKLNKNLFTLILVMVINSSCNTRIRHDHHNNIILTGLDVLVENDFSQIAGKRVGLITNQTGVDKVLTQNIDLFNASDVIKLEAIFTPEHGLFGTVPAGKNVIEKNKNLDVPVYSLYGKNKKPNKSMLKNIDILVYDIQDIGVRSYTYISTMGLAMEAAAENKIDFMVLDRPNPIGLDKIEGSILELSYKSFIGMYPIPYVYGLTSGELAKMINQSGWLGNKKCNLKIIKMKNFDRKIIGNIVFDNWIPTSPHVPHSTTPAYLVATGIIGELGVFSIGVGYTLPFKTIAAPWIDSKLIAEKMNARDLPGVMFRPIEYTPYYSIYKGELVKGIQIYITNIEVVDLILIQFHFLEIHNELYPDKNPFELAKNVNLDMFDKAIGTDKIRKKFMEAFLVSDIKSKMINDAYDFKTFKEEFHLYD